MAVLSHLRPTQVWTHFEALCAIPRPSKKEAQAAEYVLRLARSWGLSAQKDGVGNVIVRKPATKGHEQARTVVLQCHLDMVPQKTMDCPHDFERDPIRPRIVDDTVRATGTTLGADDGIGVSVALSVLQASDLVHGPLEVLFTIDEETGMTGANGLQPGLLKGDILLNLDSEDEGELCIGCAGGADVHVDARVKELPVPATALAFQIDVVGLRGGHSGVDIHLGRANANKLLARVLFEAACETDLRIHSFVGGNLRNAIARSAAAVVVVKKTQAETLAQAVARSAAVVQGEFAAADPGLRVSLAPHKRPHRAMDKRTSLRWLRALYASPHGVMAMVPDMPHVTETSTNLAIVQIARGKVHVGHMLRSSVDSKKRDVENTLRAVFELAGATVTVKGGYPGWQPNTSSPVLSLLKSIYQTKFATAARVTATHGGLECGIIRSVYPHMDAISIGPTVRFPHSPDEQVDIPSVQKFWDFLVDVLAKLTTLPT